MRVYPNDHNKKDTYLEAGELIIWRWLGVDRYFPPGYEDKPPTVLRGCSSVRIMAALLSYPQPC